MQMGWGRDRRGMRRGRGALSVSLRGMARAWGEDAG